jgi:hypothetical protein
MNDALECFGKANFVEGLEKILEWAIDTGDFFLAKSASLKLGKTLTPLEWKTLGENATTAGKLRFANSAFSLAADSENSDLVQKQMAEDIPGS